MNEKTIKLLNLVAGAAEAVILEASKLNEESYEIPAYQYHKLAKAFKDLEEAEGDEPVVEWDKYKEGYRWFAVDADGSGWVYWCLPSEGKINAWMGTGRRIGFFNLNSTDWRATLTERPNQPTEVTRT